MSHLPPVRPEDTPPIPDPKRSGPPGAPPKRWTKPASDRVPDRIADRPESRLDERWGGWGDGAPGGQGGGRSRRGLGGLALAAAAGAAVAGLAAARRLGRDTPPLYRSLRAVPREWSWSGFRIVYYESSIEVPGAAAERPSDSEPVVLVHSIHAAASAWEMRELFTRFGGDRRVLAFDLLGFGASERPDVDYDSDLYQDLLRDFVREVAGGPADVVASSVSAAHALQAAARDPSLFRSLALINPTGLLTQATGPGRRGRLVQNLFRVPWLGEALYNLLVSRPSLRYFGSRIYDRDGSGDATEEQQYVAAHQPGARFAPAAFLGDALARNVYMALRTVEVPALSIWSPGGLVDTEREREAFAAVAPGIEQVWVEGAGAVPHEDRPEVVEQAIRDWWPRLEGERF